jgi:hypothetical protein
MITGSCTGWFDGYWRQCCDLHDLAYAIGAPKMQADFDLASCVAQSGHAGIAVLMLAGVTLFGWIFYPRKKR